MGFMLRVRLASFFAGAAAAATSGGDFLYKDYKLAHDSMALKSQARAAPYRLRRQKSEILRAQYIDVRELRICVGTWNVGTKCPPVDLDIQEWLDIDEPAHIYVLG
ncbi:hypothetical protein C2845_PM02G09260 [Panicum miliaceum]|uniref:Inositol polyphosphate-related phosphatase domain-containing protein n=1 Tax=Panicum miliaceum TaxID=4540 RepID=A0A3L6SDW6_PANMI|nr:hypothetical protein C2845_PM02G09260 [Panicum miliaceum]